MLCPIKYISLITSKDLLYYYVSSKRRKLEVKETDSQILGLYSRNRVQKLTLSNPFSYQVNFFGVLVIDLVT